jgi:hypothetical protein
MSTEIFERFSIAPVGRSTGISKYVRRQGMHFPNTLGRRRRRIVSAALTRRLCSR